MRKRQLTLKALHNTTRVALPTAHRGLQRASCRNSIVQIHVPVVAAAQELVGAMVDILVEELDGAIGKGKVAAAGMPGFETPVRVVVEQVVRVWRKAHRRWHSR